MLKSWLSFLLPEDEYKEKHVLYFLAEAGVIVFLIQTLLLTAELYLESWNLDAVFGLFISFAVFSLYTTLRYMISGIEYTEVASKKTYAKEKKHIIKISLGFVTMYFIIYTIFRGIPKTAEGWLEIIGFLLLLAVFHFGIHYLSLKRSYNKNKELTDEE